MMSKEEFVREELPEASDPITAGNVPSTDKGVKKAGSDLRKE